MGGCHGMMAAIHKPVSFSIRDKFLHQPLRSQAHPQTETIAIFHEHGARAHSQNIFKPEEAIVKL